jgi:hypothetical protein
MIWLVLIIFDWPITIIGSGRVSYHLFGVQVFVFKGGVGKK